MFHAIEISELIQGIVQIINDEVPTEQFQPREYVYYLMVAPEVVKIGTTTNLPRRVRELRSELQYVVAIEKGGFTLENQRHKQFSEERTVRLRENFRLSNRLKSHIEELMPTRDELIAEANTAPFGEMVPITRPGSRQEQYERRLLELESNASLPD
jgi:hypothetical protein